MTGTVKMCALDSVHLVFTIFEAFGAVAGV